MNNSMFRSRNKALKGEIYSDNNHDPDLEPNP